jgi:seryl-tRNA synthetase
LLNTFWSKRLNKHPPPTLSMLDIKFIMKNPDVLKKELKKRNKANIIWTIDELIQDYDSWKQVKSKIDELRHQRNSLSQEVNKLKKQKKDTTTVLKEVKSIPDKIKKLEKNQSLLSEKIQEKLYALPNISHDSVPKGKDEKDNKEVRKSGKIHSFSFPVKNHEDLAEQLGIADFEAGRFVSGERFNYLLGPLALLDLALQRYGIDFAQQHKFQMVVPPILIKKDVMGGVVNITDFEDTIYKIEGEDLHAIGTAENSLIPLFANKTLNVKELPIRVAAVTPCFRKELGHHGIDTKGLFRMHQFNKVEQVIICHPKDSYKLLEEIQKISEKFFTSLKIPHRTLEICSGDLGNKQAKQYDIEAWFPRQKAYKEITSASNCTDYQARKLNIKYKQGQEKGYVHILNNTMVATSRTMVAILENFQNKDGSVTMPTVLHKYLGFKKITPKK